MVDNGGILHFSVHSSCVFLVLKWIARCGRERLESLLIDVERRDTFLLQSINLGLSYISFYCKELKEIHLFGLTQTPQLMGIATECQYLDTVVLEGISPSQIAFDIMCKRGLRTLVLALSESLNLDSFFDNCHKTLKELDISSNNKYTFDLDKLKDFVHLERLTINTMGLVSKDKSIEFPNMKMLNINSFSKVDIGWKLSGLTSLRIYGEDLIEYHPKVVFPLLERIEFYCYMIEEQAWMDFVGTLPLLKTIVIIDDEGVFTFRNAHYLGRIRQLVEKCKRLEHLHIETIDAFNTKPFNTVFPHIKVSQSRCERREHEYDYWITPNPSDDEY
eukprot:TRINITY_DN6341_c0_g1_i4.p1 TRINITY_DN6341_c0_g1~~TRINITY_DN6341_c0_g1_i4.p1  ORF type:complete len:332 (+),score=62.74 TRINITY_DN6341_c0_g1_i4:352-1347(+)